MTEIDDALTKIQKGPLGEALRRLSSGHHSFCVHPTNSCCRPDGVVAEIIMLQAATQALELNLV